jgi:hypothetical protein
MSIFSMVEANQKLREENVKLLEENARLTRTMDTCVVEYQALLDENRYLKQKVKEYRHKTWFPVYEENLKLQQEIEQYKTVLASVESFIGQYSKEKKVDKECH